MNRVHVYRFWITDPEHTEIIRSPHAATAAAIARIERARPISATVQEVEEIQLDGDGFLVA